MIKSSLLCLVFTFVNLTHADCADALRGLSLREPFAGVLGFPSGHRLFLRVEPPPTPVVRGWFILVHGLLQDESAYDQVVPLLNQAGYGVVRPDIYGFGQSRPPEFQQTTIPFETNVADLKHLLTLFDDQSMKPEIVGHSMGGGLVASLLTDPAARAKLYPRATLLAPYAYRLEFHLADKALGMGYLGSSVTSNFVDQLPAPLRHAFETMLNISSGPQMHLVFHGYLHSTAATESYATRGQRIRVAIATTKGLADLKTLECLKQVPAEFKLRHVLGQDDKVVEPLLERKVAAVVKKNGGETIELNADHWMLQKTPETVARILLGQGLD